MDKKHLIIVLFAVLFTSSLLIFFRVPVLSLSRLSQKDLSSAQDACNFRSYNVTTQPAGHIFTKQCVNDGALIYEGDSRYTFFNVPGGVLPAGFSYVRTDNVNAKNDLSLNWNITLVEDSIVYVYYRRRLAPTRPPAWLDSTFTSNTAQTAIDVNALNHYLLRKNNANTQIGAYDAYFVQRSAGSVINFGPATDGSNPALSMYIVAVVSDPSGSPSPSAFPVCQPGIDCDNDGGNVVSPTPIATSTASPDPTAFAEPTSNPNARETSVFLQTRNGSGQSGYAVITEMGSTQTRVSLSLFGGNYTDQPARIQSGSCTAPGAVVYTLNNVNGTSITYLNVPYSTVVNNIGIVNITKSAAEANASTACGVK